MRHDIDIEDDSWFGIAEGYLPSENFYEIGVGFRVRDDDENIVRNLLRFSEGDLLYGKLTQSPLLLSHRGIHNRLSRYESDEVKAEIDKRDLDDVSEELIMKNTVIPLEYQADRYEFTLVSHTLDQCLFEFTFEYTGDSYILGAIPYYDYSYDKVPAGFYSRTERIVGTCFYVETSVLDEFGNILDLADETFFIKVGCNNLMNLFMKVTKKFSLAIDA